MSKKFQQKNENAIHYLHLFKLKLNIYQKMYNFITPH